MEQLDALRDNDRTEIQGMRRGAKRGGGLGGDREGQVLREAIGAKLTYRARPTSFASTPHGKPLAGSPRGDVLDHAPGRPDAPSSQAQCEIGTLPEA